MYIFQRVIPNYYGKFLEVEVREKNQKIIVRIQKCCQFIQGSKLTFGHMFTLKIHTTKSPKVEHKKIKSNVILVW